MMERRPRAPVSRCEGAVGDRLERVVGEDQVDVVEAEEAPVLAHEGVLGLGQDLHQVLARELVHRGDDRQAPDELRDQPVVHEVLGEHLAEDVVRVVLAPAADLGGEAHALVADAPLDDLLEVRERAAADEQHVRGVDREELLVGVLAPPLGRHRRHRALEDLQQRLLHALARHVARDRRVVRLARDLVDLVDVDDPGLGLLDVEVGRLDELEQDVLDVLAHVAGLGEGGRVGDREGHVEDARQRLREQRLAAPGGAEQQDVALLELDVAVARRHHVDALVVVVDGHRQRALGLLLPHHVVVQHVVDLARPRQRVGVEADRGGQLLVDDLVAEIDALVADVDAGTGDQLLDLPLRLAAEAAEELLVRLVGLGHREGARPVPASGSRSPGRRCRTPWPPRSLMKKSRSVSLATFSRSWPVCLAMISSSRLRRSMISRAWISMSVAWPLKPLDTWWIRIFAFGSAMPLARRAAGEQQGAHAHRDADADRRTRRA